MPIPTPRDPVEQGRDRDLRIALLERRLARGGIPDRLLPGGSDIVSSYYGTTAERDAAHGVPTTDAGRAFLANLKTVWFNTDLGWSESYYAPQGTVGLTAPALVAGTAAGWYPTGEGPTSKLYASAQQSMTANTYVTLWSAWGTGESVRRGGDEWFTRSLPTGAVVCEKAGNYEVSAMTTQQTGAGTTVTHILRNGNSISANTNALSSQVTSAPLYQPETAVTAGSSLAVFSAVGSYLLNVATGTVEVRGYFHVRYKGPLLVSD